MKLYTLLAKEIDSIKKEWLILGHHDTKKGALNHMIKARKEDNKDKLEYKYKIESWRED